MAQPMPLPLTVSCFNKIQIGFTFLILTHPGSLDKGPLNGCVRIPGGLASTLYMYMYCLNMTSSSCTRKCTVGTDNQPGFYNRIVRNYTNNLFKGNIRNN